MTITINPGTLNCPSNLTSFVVGGAQGAIASVDPVLGRVIIFAATSKIYDSITNAFVVNVGAAAEPNPKGCWVKSVQKFAAHGTVAASRGYVLIDSTAGTTTQVGNKLQLFSVPCYADDDDCVYGFGYDSGGTNKLYLTRLNIGTMLVDISIDEGVPAGTPIYTAYCPTPKRLLVNLGGRYANNFTLLGGLSDGVIDFNTSGFGALYEVEYNPVTLTFFAAIVQDTVAVEERVVELDPNGLGIIRTYNLGEANVGGNMQLGVDPDNGAVYCNGRTKLTCIDAVGTTIKCQVAFPNTVSASFDKAAGKIFAGNFSTGNANYYDK